MKTYPLDTKTKLGVAVTALSSSMTNAIFTVLLMIFITDYSGIYSGVAGKAAAVGTGLLFAGRLWDAFNDPFFGFVIDRSPRTKIGKFKPYIIIGEIIAIISCIAIFNIPNSLTDQVKIVWLYAGYFIWAIGFTISQPIPLVSTLSNDNSVKSKLISFNRLGVLISAVLVVSIIPITEVLGGNMGLTVAIFMIPLAILSLTGVSQVKEGESTRSIVDRVGLKDMLSVIKNNRPLRVMILSRLFGGFAFTFVVGAGLYYIKYGYGVDSFELHSTLFGTLQLLSAITGTVIAAKLISKRNPIYAYSFLLVIQVICFTALFGLNLISTPNIIIFFILQFFALGASGGSYIPTSVIYMECMTYNKYTTGKGMEAVTNSVNAFLEKTQGALSATVVGFFLVLIGYDVNLYENATSIPSELLSGLGFIIFLLPAIVTLIAAIIIRKYPINDELRKRMGELNEKS